MRSSSGPMKATVMNVTPTVVVPHGHAAGIGRNTHVPTGSLAQSTE